MITEVADVSAKDDNFALACSTCNKHVSQVVLLAALFVPYCIDGHSNLASGPWPDSQAEGSIGVSTLRNVG